MNGKTTYEKEVILPFGKTTDETEVILPFEGRNQPLAYQKQFQAVLRLSQTLNISRKIMKIPSKIFSNGYITRPSMSNRRVFFRFNGHVFINFQCNIVSILHDSC